MVYGFENRKHSQQALVSRRYSAASSDTVAAIKANKLVIPKHLKHGYIPLDNAAFSRSIASAGKKHFLKHAQINEDERFMQLVAFGIVLSGSNILGFVDCDTKLISLGIYSHIMQTNTNCARSLTREIANEMLLIGSDIKPPEHKGYFLSRQSSFSRCHLGYVYKVQLNKAIESDVKTTSNCEIVELDVNLLVKDVVYESLDEWSKYIADDLLLRNTR